MGNIHLLLMQIEEKNRPTNVHLSEVAKKVLWPIYLAGRRRVYDLCIRFGL